MTGLDFVVVDFETANRRHESACQVGLARVRGGRLEAVEAWLIIPPTGLDSFEAANVRIHGITPEALLRGSPLDWPATVERMHAFAGDLPFVAHNVAFDRTVFGWCCDAFGLTLPERRWLDSLSVSRRVLDLPNHRLSTVVDHLGIEGHTHHDAGSDAAVTAEAVLRMAGRSGAVSVDELWPPARSRGAGMGAYTGRGYSASVAELPAPSPDADPAHFFYGQRVCITGEIPGCSRWDAFEALARCGAQVEKGVTKRTSVLVVAGRERIGPDYNPLLGSAKERKAAQYRLAGQRLVFIGAADFRAMAL
ncbi:exonuclease domain-containing protein [Falsarthrobacter nasiphocae]|uniref:DNA polymerase-3 subunit epsilon n=1 Tax=Falsarthrobacter nasiphocae TaxID=189863 RepID=A0AAE4C8C7_9MICC|nr:exonuclease domain-containing protein [Falsarthrobacter nasiphocae]MDR6892270.1 DNA polymerase-3 subunit epsilon [Falsarthrobacter nasiphocae]